MADLDADFSALVRKFEALEDAFQTLRGRKTKTEALAAPVESDEQRKQREILEARERRRALHAGG